MTDLSGGPSLPQERRLVTAVPGPKSTSCWPASRPPSPPASAPRCPSSSTRAGGGVLDDADGNSLIDFGSGIAVTSVGNSAEAVVRRARRSWRTSRTRVSWSPRTSRTWRSASSSPS